MKRWIVTAALLALPAMPIAYADGLPELGEAAEADLPAQTERAIGERTMADIRLHESGYIADPEINGYLTRLANRLAAQLDGPKPALEAFALRDATLNAFAMPGGFIGVHTGLIATTQSESELASVIGHEISHVTQRHLARMVGKQKVGQMAAMLALAVGVLAARSHSDLASGAMVGGQAAAIQNQLSYSRDFEREADRMGIQLLERAGFDIRGMGDFFGRMEKYGRLYESGAPGYLRTHPLTEDRISDMGNRIQLRPYKQVTDSLDYTLVRAKVQAEDGTPQEAVAAFAGLVHDRKFRSEAGARYGLVRARLRAGDAEGAERDMAALQKLKASSSMIETLAAEVRLKRGDAAGAVRILRAARNRYPQERAVVYDLAEDLLQARQPAESLQLLNEELQSYSGDPRLYEIQAKAYEAQGKRFLQHRALAESYALQGLHLAAIEQLELAQKSRDGDFYGQSQVDARMRDLKARYAEENRPANKH